MAEERRAIPMAKPVEGAVAAVVPGLTPAPADTTPSVTGEPRPDAGGGPPRSSSTPPPAARDAAARRRLALRIPDDEIARPQPAEAALGRADRTVEAPGTSPSPRAVDVPPVVVMPTRIISIDAPAPPRGAAPAAFAPPARASIPPPPPSARLDGVRPGVPAAPKSRLELEIDGPPDPEPVTPRVAPPLEAEEVEVRFDDDVPTPVAPPFGLPAAPSVPEPVADVASSAAPAADAAAAYPTHSAYAAPATNAAATNAAATNAAATNAAAADAAATNAAPATQVAPGTHAPPTNVAPATHAAPPSEERRAPPSDPPEVAAEDVVALDPAPARAALPPMRPRLLSQPGAPPGPPLHGSAAAVPAPSPRPGLVIVPPHVGSMPPPSSEAVARRKGRLWWEDLFNDDYLRTAEKVADDQIAREVAFIEESLGVERGGVVLDLACGTGRHAIELARRGYEVVGFDLSLAMLARAGEEAQDRGVPLNFVQGDMREMTFEEQFDGVYCWSTSFGYFDEEKNAQVIDRVHRALKAGGFFLLDVANRDFVIRQSPSLAWFEGDGCVCMDEMSVDFITSRMKVKRTLMLDDGRSREIEYSVRVYSLHELGRILHEHGFKVREVSGRLATPGVFFGEESPRTIILAEKH